MGSAKSHGSDAKKQARAASKALVGEQRSTLRLEPIRAFAGVLFDEDLHAKRVESLANGVAGVLNAAMLTIHASGRAYAAMAHIEARSGVKQIVEAACRAGTTLGHRTRALFVAATSSLAFACWHLAFNDHAFVAHFLFGLAMWMLRSATRSVAPCIVVHSIANLLSAAAFYS